MRLPKVIVGREDLRDGETVELVEVDGEVILRKRLNRADLDRMFAEGSPERWRELYRDAYPWGEGVGQEQILE